ncbi:MAG: hypothetical protein IPL28_05985 [Chloroflexi bacterium]|nr:hypothetical protein [Chloroflexota bacterium]
MAVALFATRWAIIAQASRDQTEVITADLDLALLAEWRRLFPSSPTAAERLWATGGRVGNGDTAEKVAQYQAEPYVLAADVYGVAPNVGRGLDVVYGVGGLDVAAGVEGILGVRKVGRRCLWSRASLIVGMGLRWR